MENNTIPIIYEDDAVLVINKPAGIAVHEDGHTDGPFLTDWVRAHKPELVGVGETMSLQNGTVIDRPGVVHRLDRDTSGVLVLAKTQSAFEFLKEQFQNHNMEKQYLAFVWGEMRDLVGTVDKPIGRSRNDFRRWATGHIAGGKMRTATTRWTKLGRAQGCTYLSVEPKTGRTHQIRVHMHAIGHPVVGDTRYAPQKGTALGFARLALHAQSLALTHPNGSRMAFEAPLPDDFVSAIALLQK
jgi:23S rRNA pseudouridine1911/1915/1917 synthase